MFEQKFIIKFKAKDNKEAVLMLDPNFPVGDLYDIGSQVLSYAVNIMKDSKQEREEEHQKGCEKGDLNDETS